MKHRNPFPRPLAVAVALAAALPAAPTWAADAGEEIQTMVVTGSRIARTELEASTPVQLLSSDFLDQQGAPNIADVLAELPAVGTPGFSRTNTNFATTGTGVSTINLRNLGDDRTLVLVNGRRVTAGVGGSSSVDINNIPTALVERVEVITGGASAVYGSEAIAGVVNFILKKDFEGLDVRGQWGRTSEDDNIRSLLSLTYGWNFADTGNITVHVSHDRDDGLRSKNRELSEEDVPFRSSFVPQGRFAVPGGSVWTFNRDNSLKEGFNGAVDGFNRNGERYIAVPVDRKLITLLGHYDFTDSLSLFAEASYSDMNSNARLEPLATDNSDAQLPDGTILAGLSIDNPFIPAAIRADMNDAEADVLPFRKRLSGVFDRSNIVDREFQRYIVGLQGVVGENFNWDLYGSWGRTEDATRSETALRDRYFYALDAVVGPGGAVICRDAAARAAGCAPFNPFGFNSHSDAAATYIRNNQFDTYDAEIEQRAIAFNINGPLFELPAGAVRFAAGVEYREEESKETYSAETRSGNTLSNTLSDTDGEYDVTEGYVEVVVPLLSGVPFAELVELEGAARVGDYSTVGQVFSWKAGATWMIDDNVRFRAVYAEATRAPNIAELFDGANQDFPQGLTDPCEGVTAASSRPQDAYCRSLPGVARQIAIAGEYVMDDNFDRQSIEGFDRSNPDLSEEEAETWTVGLVLTPEFLPGFQMSIDWFQIEITDAILLAPRQVTIDQCVATAGASSLCSLLTREPANPVRPRTPGSVFQVDAQQLNAAFIRTAGYDLATRYSFDALDSEWNVSLVYTYLSDLEQQDSATLPVTDNKGQLDGDGRLGAGFEHRANASLTWTRGNFSATWRSNFLGRVRDTRIDIDPVDAPNGEENRIPSMTYHDLQVSYEFDGDESYKLYFGIDNVFDKRAPLIDQNRASNITGTETAADSYDAIGRFMYAGLEFSLN